MTFHALQTARTEVDILQSQKVGENMSTLHNRSVEDKSNADNRFHKSVTITCTVSMAPRANVPV